jgi:hypothetical protein
MVQTSDFGSHDDAASRLDGACHRSILAEREVSPRPLVVRDVGPKDPTKMPLIEHDDVVQTLAADRADDAFDVGVLLGRARCRADGGEAEGLERPTERRVEGRVAVVEEEPRVRVVGKGLADLPSGPGGRGVRRYIDMQDAPSVVSQDNKDEEYPAGEHGHSEEVDGDGRAEMFSRNVRHVCEGGLRRRGISREIVRSDTSNPSFINSP